MQLMKLGIGVQKIDCIFISHLHGDHYLGLPGLLFSMHLQRRTADLHIYAFAGLEEILLPIFRHANSTLHYNIVFHRLQPEASGIIFDSDQLSVTTLPLTHKIACTGFVFREKPKNRRINKELLPKGMLLQHIALLLRGEDVRGSAGEMLFENRAYTLPPRPSVTYAYLSDTRYEPALAEQLQGVKVLYHEATFMEQEREKAIETRHSTAREAALMALQAGVTQLLVGHFSARYRDLQPLLAEARDIFPNTHLAEELQTFTLAE